MLQMSIANVQHALMRYHARAHVCRSIQRKMLSIELSNRLTLHESKPYTRGNKSRENYGLHVCVDGSTGYYHESAGLATFYLLLIVEHEIYLLV